MLYDVYTWNTVGILTEQYSFYYFLYTVEPVPMTPGQNWLPTIETIQNQSISKSTCILRPPVNSDHLYIQTTCIFRPPVY